ncbi:MAG: hypothetical protein F7C35_06700 [Desulfurococcales archaeon]|nr:hypothetical protein [Desulfurococcales archaeon]
MVRILVFSNWVEEVEASHATLSVKIFGLWLEARTWIEGESGILRINWEKLLMILVERIF